MTGSSWILAIDQGTSGTTCLAVLPDGTVEHRAATEVSVRYPQPGWVEQDGTDLWLTAKAMSKKVIDHMGGPPAALGITNQRETVVTFDRESLEPVIPAIVWQCKRSAVICEELARQGNEPLIRSRTGLVLDPYFSASKMRWVMNNHPALVKKLESGELAFATVDAWLVAALTGGHSFLTDASNASRTMLVDIAKLEYDEELLALFGVPRAALPDIAPSSGRIAETDPERFHGFRIPICGIAGDQQAALFGQGCVHPGMAKSTYGTGSFLLANAGPVIPDPIDGILTTVGWKIGETTAYALEGGTFTAGAALKWARDQLGLISDYGEIDELCRTDRNAEDVAFIPALSGLGSPWWEPGVRGAFIRLTQGSSRGDLISAIIEAIAFRTRDIVERMHDAGGFTLTGLRVDGGVTRSDRLCDLQSRVLGVPVVRASTPEVTGRGAALLAAVGADLIDDVSEVADIAQREGTSFSPGKDALDDRYRQWARYRDALIAVESTKLQE